MLTPQVNTALHERLRLDPGLGVRMFHAINGAITLLDQWPRRDPAENQVLCELLAARDIALQGIDHE